MAWLIADGDMHLKNLALLKIAAPGADTFESVRLAPLYDAVTTRVFPGLEHDRMALKLGGKDDRLHRTEIEAVVQGNDRDTRFDTLITSIGAAIASDRTLGGLCDWVEAEALRPVNLPVEGTATLKAAAIPVILHYTTADPLSCPADIKERDMARAQGARAQMALARLRQVMESRRLAATPPVGSGEISATGLFAR